MTCGYVCPQCEGRGVLENGDPCDYCTRPVSVAATDDTAPDIQSADE